MYGGCYDGKMSYRELLDIFAEGVYTLDLETGKLYRGEREITPFTGNRCSSLRRKFVRLYNKRRVKTIAVARLVWMIGTGCVVPPNFEVHHRDEDHGSDGFNNLICVHKLDHRKLHSGSESDPIPF